MRLAGYLCLSLGLLSGCDLSDLTEGEPEPADGSGGSAGGQGGNASSTGGESMGASAGDLCAAQDFCVQFEDNEPELSVLFDEVRTKDNSTATKDSGELSVKFSGALAGDDCSYADVKKAFEVAHSGYRLRVAVHRSADADGFLLTAGHRDDDASRECLDLLAFNGDEVTLQTNATLTTVDNLSLTAPTDRWLDVELESRAIESGGTRHTITIDGESASVDRPDCDVGAALEITVGFFCSPLVSGEVRYDDLRLEFID